jgi:error-prone DNA polymerase
VVFVTVEDEFGEANLVVYANVGARDRQALLGARLLVAEGRVERLDDHAEVPILHLIARKLIDRSDPLDRLGQVDVNGAGSGSSAALTRCGGPSLAHVGL